MRLWIVLLLIGTVLSASIIKAKPAIKALNRKLQLAPTTTMTMTTITTTPTTTTTTEEETTTTEIITLPVEGVTETTEETIEDPDKCDCPERAAVEFNEDGNATQIRQCTCKEAKDCEEEIDLDAVNTCFDDCHSQLEFFGNDTQNYTQCFTDKNINGFSAAEICLQSRVGDGCNKGNDEKMIDIPDYDIYTDFTYRNQSKYKELYSEVQKKTHDTFQTFQRFYHCSKNCIHKRLFQCFNHKQCAIVMPKYEKFEEAMQACAKDHSLAYLNLWNTCRCLITEQKLNLTGQCAVLINPYYLARL